MAENEVVKRLKLLNETVSGSQGKVFMEIDNSRYVVANLIKFKGKFKINNTKKGVLGYAGKQSKPSGWEGTWEATLYYNQSTLRMLAKRYAEDGILPVFSIQVVNEDPGSVKTIGRQSVTFEECVPDEMLLSIIDVDAEVLEEDLSGTFNNFKLNDSFSDFPRA